MYWLACVFVCLLRVTGFVDIGTLLAKRLAARLIPRFMREFPDKIPKAVECLLDVIVASRVGNQQQQQQQQHRMIWEGLRRDALEGLGNTCDLIVKNVQRPEQLLGKVVHCLLRQVIEFKRSRG